MILDECGEIWEKICGLDQHLIPKGGISLLCHKKRFDSPFQDYEASKAIVKHLLNSIMRKISSLCYA